MPRGRCGCLIEEYRSCWSLRSISPSNGGQLTSALSLNGRVEITQRLAGAVDRDDAAPPPIGIPETWQIASEPRATSGNAKRRFKNLWAACYIEKDRSWLTRVALRITGSREVANASRVLPLIPVRRFPRSSRYNHRTNRRSSSYLQRLAYIRSQRDFFLFDPFNFNNDWRL